MSRRIDIELTSRTADGAFTWRAAGARQPRGTVGEQLLPSGIDVGAVVRAELESGLDGFEVVAVLARPDKPDERASNRIEVLGAPRSGPDVSVTYAPGGRRRREDRGGGAESAGGRAPRREGAGRRPGAGRGPAEGPGGPRRDGAEGRQRAEHADGGRTDGGRTDGGRTERARPSRGRAESTERPGRAGRRPGGLGEDRRGPAPIRRDRRPSVSTTHRNALLATLGPQELPIAEQLLGGGLPAVRQAIAEQNATRPGAAAVNGDAVLAIAEHLLPRVTLASWKDRASSAQLAGKELRLRELRAVVTASRTVTLDEEGRGLARTLQESLDQRVAALRDEWLARMDRALGEGRVAEALIVSARPPEPATRLPADLAVRLADTAGAAMAADADPADWLPLLEAVVGSPVRRTVKPRGIPDVPEAQEAARRAAGSVPELAKLLGLRIPPPPPRRPASGGPRVMAGGGAGRAAGR